MSMNCPKHPSDVLFEDLTSDSKHIRHICLTCIAETLAPPRVQKRQAAIEDARRKVRLDTLLREAKSAVSFAWIVFLVVVFLAPIKGLEAKVMAGFGALVMIFLSVILYRVASLDQVLRTPLPSVESVRKELEPSYSRQATARVRRFKDNLRQQFEIEASGIAETDKMPGVRFERFLADFFERRGFAVTRTPGSGDYGVDLVLQKGGKRTAVQCKRWEGAVGLVAIQEVHAGKDYYKCEGAMVVTNARFSEQARTLAERLSIDLWDRKRLTAELSRTQLRVSWEEYLRRHYMDLIIDCSVCGKKNRVLYSHRAEALCGNCNAHLPWH